AGARIEVEDNGPGIAPEIRGALFEPFATTKEVGKGTGLGLAVCRGLVEAAGGVIAVEDAEARGARFVLRLPAARVG
ncbi:MAG: HAMP domain-containing histidine kinase, partial [Polyangiaceae bacterium]|nr:HAMP domain-containing histidine kinase [Polyangiaceae bacterium]